MSTLIDLMSFVAPYAMKKKAALPVVACMQRSAMPGKGRLQPCVTLHSTQAKSLSLHDSQKGATLVELIISIVILSILSVGIMSLISGTVLNSSKPLIRTQAIAIAQSYMEEILSRPLDDPSGSDGETVRASFDDVDDYNNLSDQNGAENSSGNIITGLEGYNVTVSVTDVTVNGLSGEKIQVTVTHDSGSINLPVTAYRFN